MARETLSKLKRFKESAREFLQEKGIEHGNDAERTKLERFAHFWLLVGKSFMRNRCPVRASALAYTTLLALIPLLAVGVSITTGLLQQQGKEPVEKMIDKLVQNVAPMLDLESRTEGAAEGATNREQVVEHISSFVGNIRSGTLGVFSTLALVFVAIGLLRTIEATLNDIWGIRSGRGWVASIIQYWATITLGPLILVLVLGLTTGPHTSAFTALVESTLR